LTDHCGDLRAGFAKNKELQKDWELYGAENFVLEILDLGDDFIHRQTQLEYETGYINIDPKRCYNILANPQYTNFPGSPKKCTINGTTCNSIQEAAIAYDTSRFKLECRLSDKNFEWPLPTYTGEAFKKRMERWLESQRKGAPDFTGKLRVLANGKIYNSVAECVDALGIGTTTLYKYIRSNDKPLFFSVDDQGRQVSPEQVSRARARKSVRIGKNVYPSIKAAAIGEGTNKIAVSTRCKSKDFPDYEFVEETFETIKKAALDKSMTSQLETMYENLKNYDPSIERPAPRAVVASPIPVLGYNFPSQKQCSEALRVSKTILLKFLKEMPEQFFFVDTQGNPLVFKPDCPVLANGMHFENLYKAFKYTGVYQYTMLLYLKDPTNIHYKYLE